ncbi:YdeI/OmpD-associated family protein [Chryseobacterium cucumeris]|uniref:YdeI/OmpD-associated family protein n=1 Tax=Chryseobacterium cucumeris TaxID=1813611 RepID=UPI00192DA8F3|nr:YdeI/OmpD-associated family protein [Chryseobacterium cucumeris]QRA44281.1 YdeI/OmpD-associated family protein [Chryseobacterium cucumeris]
MGKIAEKQTFNVNTRAEWRQWLEENHHTEQSVWLICNTRKSNLPNVSWSELVDEALCFGWIDSTRKTIDEGSFMQLFSRRKPKSTWSKINKEKVQKLIKSNLMMKAGFETIRIAKENGSWTILDSVEDLIIPEDLNEAFKIHEGSEAFFQSLSKSVKKMMLQWIVLAKRPETRKNRIDEIARQAAQNRKPKNF